MVTGTHLALGMFHLLSNLFTHIYSLTPFNSSVRLMSLSAFY